MLIWLGLFAGNCAYQYFNGGSMNDAYMHSYYQGIAILAYWGLDKFFRS